MLIRQHLLPTLALVLMASGSAAAQRPNGDWVLDQAVSDSMPARLGPDRFASLGVGHEGEGGGGPPTAGGAPTAGMGRGRPRELNARQLSLIQQSLELARWTPTRISISGDTSVSLTDWTGSQVTWRIDGSWVLLPGENGAEVEARVRWKEDALVIERRVDGGGRESQTCELGLGGSRMLVYVAVDGLPMPIALTRTYRR